MYKQGVILELRRREAVVFNDVGEYEKIKKTEGMFVGQVINYTKAVNKYVNALIPAMSVAAVLIAILFSYGFFQNSREQVFAYVTLDINPSMEFSINKENCVLSLRSLNQDAEEITKSLEVKGKRINDAVSDVMCEVERLGYISPEKETVILLSTAANASLDKHDKRNVQIDKTIASIKETVKNCTKNNAYVKAISSTSEIRNLSIKENMSLGRYVLYTKALEQGESISAQDAKTAPLSQLVKKAEIDQDNSDITDSTQNSPGDLSQASKTTLDKNKDEDKLGIDKPGIDKPGTDKSDIDKPGIDKSGTDKPGIDKPGIDKPGIDKPGIDKPGIDKPGMDKPGMDKPGMDKPGMDKPGMDKPGIDKPEVDRPEIERPEIERPEIDKPGIDRPEIGRPEIGRPEIGRPQIGRPIIDKPFDNFGKDNTINGLDSPRFGRSDVTTSPNATMPRIEDGNRSHLATPTVPANTYKIPEPTPSPAHPLRIRERRRGEGTLTP